MTNNIIKCTILHYYNNYIYLLVSNPLKIKICEHDERYNETSGELRVGQH